MQHLQALSRFLEDFETVSAIGNGTFCQVFICRHRLTGWLYAV
jgi:hypothetical protein